MAPTRSAVIHARVRPDLKRRAEGVFRRLGLTTSDALNAFYSQVAMRRAFPFPLEIPNAETRKAIEDSRRGKGKTYRTAEEMDRALGL